MTKEKCLLTKGVSQGKRKITFFTLKTKTPRIGEGK